MAGFAQRDAYMPDMRSFEGLLDERNMLNRGDPQDYIQRLIDELNPLERLSDPITNEVDMGPDPYQGDPNRYEQWDPNESYQVAGDVVRGPLPRTMEDLSNATKPFQGSGGMMSINKMGGVKNPYLDLLDILAYPQGGQIRK